MFVNNEITKGVRVMFVANKFKLSTFTALLISSVYLTSCCKNSDQKTVESDQISSVKDPIILKSEFAYQAELGNMVEGKSSTPELFQKKLATSIGAEIIMPEFFIWSFDSSEWEKGGKLYIFNDYSMGNEFQVRCALSPEDGDKMMTTKKRRDVDLKGVISSYSSASGLLIDPCEITRDELETGKSDDHPKDNSSDTDEAADKTADEVRDTANNAAAVADAVAAETEE